jgi:hypothetical protein
VKRKSVRSLSWFTVLFTAACGSATPHGQRAAGTGHGGEAGLPNAASAGSGTMLAGSGGVTSTGGMSSGRSGAGGTDAGTSGSSGDAGQANALGGASDGGMSGASTLGGASAVGGNGSGAVGGTAAGTTGSAGKGVGTPDICTFQIDATPSATIPTVGIVNWTTDLAGLSAASIEFTLDAPAPNTLNTGSGGEIDISGTTHRALLLGLKAQQSYTYRIVVKSGDTTCTSADQTFVTGAGIDAPNVKRQVMDGSAQAHGFVVTSGGYHGGKSGAWQMAYIIDADGDVVWWADSPANCSRALMDWEGENVWMVDVNPSPVAQGTVHRVAMDGTGAEDVDGFALAHHDLAVVPGGIVAFLMWGDIGDTASDLVERSPDGTLKTVVRLDEQLFGPASTDGFHANSVMYHSADDTYTVSDLYAETYVKLTRQGKLLWAFAHDCTNSPAPLCATGALGGNHGHHLLTNGNLLFFTANIGPSPVYEYAFTESATALTANQIWTYESPNLGSDVLGDIQRLPNGNTLVDYCRDGVMQELSPTNDIVQVLTATAPPNELPMGNYPPPDSYVYTFGYMNFRETLYGAPLR